MSKEIPVVKHKPVARFFYKGSHTHPVRRTVLLTETGKDYIRGYELREGMSTRLVDEAPVKTFRINEIAQIGQIDRRRILRQNTPFSKWNNTTLHRSGVKKLMKKGV